ncbi:hypothetical protein SELMODRAFT_415456 [Selaginella moellendorffii]|uniref:Germin-like protein n=1 Tax=Selaginella moellendorffii TaxID=88036 RepID=D8RW61_SELML|nr:hypothetical protein SELMODRAFT_415456 [Selaginella moellendorffii]
MRVFIFLRHIYEYYTTQVDTVPHLAIEPSPLVSPLRKIARDVEMKENFNDTDSSKEDSPFKKKFCLDPKIQAVRPLGCCNVDTTNESTYTSNNDTPSADKSSEMRQPQQQQTQHYKVKASHAFTHKPTITKKVDGVIGEQNHQCHIIQEAFVKTFPGLHCLLGSTLWRVASSAFVYITWGRLYAGFIDTANRAFARVYSKGEVMIFPRGLIHWQLNVSSIGFCRAKQREARVSDHSSAHVREWCRGRSSPKGISAGRSDCTQACRRVCSHR